MRRAVFGAALAVFIIIIITGVPARAGNRSVPGIKFGLAAGVGDFGDRAYNDQQRHGLVLGHIKYGIEFETAASKRPEQGGEVIRALIEQGCGVVICGDSYNMVGAVDELSKEYPDVKFILLDEKARNYPENVASVTFRQNEAGFLAGYLAGEMSRTGRIGFIGAEDLPVINDFLAGYEAGAKRADPGVELFVSYLRAEGGQGLNPYSASALARRIALDMYGRGADIILAAAGGSNRGVFMAAGEKESFAIGVDSDQDGMAPGRILTSVMKRLDTAIFLITGEILAGRFENRNYSLGLKEGGSSLSPMTYTRALIPDSLIERIEFLEREVGQGRITVPHRRGAR